MMSNRGSFAYHDDTTLQAIRLPYGNGKLSMYVLLPAAGVDFHAFLHGLSAASISRRGGYIDHAAGCRAGAAIHGEIWNKPDPGAEQDGHGSGVRARADLSGMVTNAQASIGAILHKAVVKVDEIGTTAAAVTGVVSTTAVMQNQFTITVDRPFFLVIRDDTTGVPLFMGCDFRPALTESAVRRAWKITTVRQAYGREHAGAERAGVDTDFIGKDQWARSPPVAEYDGLPPIVRSLLQNSPLPTVSATAAWPRMAGPAASECPLPGQHWRSAWRPAVGRRIRRRRRRWQIQPAPRRPST